MTELFCVPCAARGIASMAQEPPPRANYVIGSVSLCGVCALNPLYHWSDQPRDTAGLPLSDDDSEADADAAQQRAAFLEDPLDELNDEEPEIIRAKWMIDGAATLEEAAVLAEGFARELRGLAAGGWQLRAPVEDDYGFLARDPAAGQETAHPDVTGADPDAFYEGQETGQ
jgi:hypothetical protein